MFKRMAAAVASIALAFGLSLVAVTTAHAEDDPSHAHNPVTLCHATPPDTAAHGWHQITVDDDAVFKEGHGSEHDADIIPAFDYWAGSDKKGWTLNDFDGKNLSTAFFGTTGAQILAAGCQVTLTAQAVATPETCVEDALVPGYITVTLKDHLTYLIDGGSVTFDGTGKTNPLVAGSSHTVTVSADEGFTVTPTSFSLTIAAFDGQCGPVEQLVSPSAQATDQTCVVDGEFSSLVGGTITVGDVTHIDYTITADADGTHTPIAYNGSGVTGTLDPGDYTVHAVAKAGFTLTSTDDIHVTIAAFDGQCGQLVTHPLVDPSAVMAQMGCDTNGTYTLSSDQQDPAAVVWTVNGSLLDQGKYAVTSPGTIHVVAAPGPDYGFAEGIQSEWIFVFERPATCELTTLALTGSDPMPEFVLAGFLALFGLTLVRSGVRLRRQDSVP